VLNEPGRRPPLPQVKVDLLQRLGWLVVCVPLADWGQLADQQQRARDIRSRIKWAAGNRSAEADEAAAVQALGGARIA